MNDTNAKQGGQKKESGALSANIFLQKQGKLSEKDDLKLNDIKEQAARLYDSISELGNGRYIALAKTDLEKVVQWAEKHLHIGE